MNQRLGILGGGQLAQMMLPHAHRLGIQTTVLDNLDCPASLYSKNIIAGDYKKYEDVLKLSDCNVVTVEIENVNTQALKELERRNIRVFPSAFALELIKNKGSQKEFLINNQIPTAPFKKVICPSPEEINRNSIVKLCTGGYDGKGIWNPQNQNFPEHFLGQEIIIEEKVEIIRELSQLVVRNSLGEIQLGPLVEMIFNPTFNLIDCAFMPAPCTTSLMESSHELAKIILEKLDYVGMMAIEMFDTKKGLLINELAPRPHNSGHGTIEACFTDQFEQHLRAVMGLPLGNFKLRESALTYNIIGAEGTSGKTQINGLNEILKVPNVYPHFYGKKTCSPGRKMGHITILGNLDQNLQIKKRIEKCLSVIGN